MRRVGDERQRYSRKGLRDRLADPIDWARTHPIAAAAIVAFVVVWVALSATRSLLVPPGDLVVGDCLYVRTSANAFVDHPIGSPDEVAAGVLAGRAERAGCTASHGHEVSAVILLGSLTDPRRDPPARCAAAFEPYVGRSAASSIYTTFAAVPAPNDPARVVICLVARSDGDWMDHPARASGE